MLHSFAVRLHSLVYKLRCDSSENCFPVPTELLRNAVDGDVVDWGAFRAESTHAAPKGITHTGTGLAEERAARRLGISPADVDMHANALWGTTLTEHRDALAGPNANGQTRGRITRQLIDQIRDHADSGG